MTEATDLQRPRVGGRGAVPVSSRRARAETIHGGFEAQARRTPGRVALRCGDVSLTYAELDERATVLAGRLLERGVVDESLVAVCLPRSAQLLVSMLAVMKAGGAYVPLSPGDPTERRRHVLEDAAPVVVLTDAEGSRDAGLSAWPLVRVDEFLDGFDPAAARLDLRREVHPDQLAYVIYTSGSSGRPKGVACHHRGVANYVDWAVTTYAGSGDGGAPVFSSVGFDMVVPNLYAPLWCGQAVRMIPEDRDLSAQLSELLAGAPYSFIKLTPGQLDMVGSVIEPHAMADLAELLAVGADTFPVETLARWRAHDTTTPILNEYGPTEASVANSFYATPPDFADRTIPIGMPIPNTTMYILDEDLAPVPPGTEGDIYIGGICCARGYLGRPGLTGERFVPDPHAGVPGARMYRTGDRATWDAAGNATFLGRSDRQLKIGGYRVEPGEVEALLRSHPEIEDAAVIGRAVGDGPVLLEAYVRATGSQVPPDLVPWLEQHLPGYAVPRKVRTVATIPLDANGKVDRSALARSERETAVVPGPADIEHVLREACRTVLGVEQVGRDDNFFELGGDSIAAVRLASALRAQGYDLGLTEVFKQPTLAALAPYVVRAGAAAPEPDAVPAGPLPLSPIQRWFFDRAMAEHDHYNQSIVLEWTSEPDVFALESALQALVDAHDALRLRFLPGPDGWRQEVGETPPGYELLTEVHLDRAEDLEDEATQVQRSLDIESGRMIRAALFTVPDRPSLLLVAVHHLAVDTFSWPRIVRDLDLAYSHLLQGRPADLDPDPRTFSQWAQALSVLRADAGPVAPDPSAVSLPRDGGGDDNTVAVMECVEVRLPAAATRTLMRETPRQYGCPTEVVLMTALGAALGADHDRPTVTFDVERHGRDSRVPGGDRTEAVGWFAGVHRMTLENVAIQEENESTLRAAVKRTRTALVAGSQDRLECDIEAGPVNPGLILFNYSGQLAGRMPAAHFESWMGSAGQERPPVQGRSHDIELEIEVVDGEMTFRWLHSPELHTRAGVAAVAERCLHVLKLLVRRGPGGPEARVPSDFPLAAVDQDELDRIVADAGGVDDLYDLTPLQSGMLLHTLMGGEYGGRHVIECAEGLDVDLVAEVWRDLFRRHPALRSSVAWQGLDHPVQLVHPPETVDVEVADWTPALLEPDAEAGERRGWRPRATVARVGPGRTKVVLDCHHLWLDGWSVGVLTDEAARLYELRTGTGSALPVAVPYRRYVEWLRDPARNEAAREHWSRLLAGNRVSRIAPGAGAADGSDSMVTVRLGETTRDQVRSLVRHHGVTPAVPLLAAWAATVARTVGQEDVLLGCVVDGRTWDLPDIDRIVGLVMNTVPIRWRGDGSGPADEVLPALRDQLVDAVRHGHQSLADLQSSFAPAEGELFDNIFVVEDVAQAGGQRLFSRGPEGREEVHYACSLTVLVTDGLPIALELASRHGTLGDEQLTALAEGVVEMLTALTSAPDRKPTDLADSLP